MNSGNERSMVKKQEGGREGGKGGGRERERMSMNKRETDIPTGKDLKILSELVDVAQLKLTLPLDLPGTRPINPLLFSFLN